MPLNFNPSQNKYIDNLMAFLLKYGTAGQKEQRAEEKQKALFKRLGFDMGGLFGEGEGAAAPTRYSPEEFKQLSLGDISGLMPKGGFETTGVPFKAGTTTKVAAPKAGFARAGQVIQPSISISGKGEPSISLKPVADPSIKAKQQNLQVASGLRKEFNQAKAYKDFQVINRSERAMKQALDMSIKPDIKSKIASDQALGVLFQKMLDPDSVVRESEYARTPEGAGLFNRIGAILPKLRKGGLALADEDRQALYDIAEKLLTEGKRTLNSHIDRYSQIAELYEVDPKLIFGNIKRFELPAPGIRPRKDLPRPQMQSPEMQKLKNKYNLRF